MIIPPAAELARRYRVTNGSRFRLKDVDPADRWGKRLKPGDLCPDCGKRSLEVRWGTAFYTLYRQRPFLVCPAGQRCGFVRRFRVANDA